jgi:hypothetical protein
MPTVSLLEGGHRERNSAHEGEPLGRRERVEHHQQG